MLPSYALNIPCDKWQHWRISIKRGKIVRKRALTHKIANLHKRYLARKVYLDTEIHGGHKIVLNASKDC